jgi:CRP-like cAMP-binding protein
MGPAEEPPFGSDGVGTLGLVERVRILRRTLTFAETEIKPLFELARQANELWLPPGAELWQTNDLAGEFLIVISGTVTLHSATSGTLLFGPGSALGALESLAARPRAHSARTASEVRALKFDTAAALDLVEDNVAVGLGLLGVLARAIGNGDQAIKASGAR